MQQENSLSEYSLWNMSTVAVQAPHSPFFTPLKKNSHENTLSTNDTKPLHPSDDTKTQKNTFDVFSTPIEKNLQSDISKITFLTPNHDTYSSRFIPKRPSSISRQLFDLPEELITCPGDISNFSDIEANNLMYSTLLEQELLNLDHTQQKKSSQQPQDNWFSQFQPSTYTRTAKKKDLTPLVQQTKNNDVIINRPRLLDFSDKKRKKSGNIFQGNEEGFESSEKMQLENVETGYQGEIRESLTHQTSSNPIIQNILNLKKINKHPYKVLDAPGLQDDFYQNILDWSSNNVISIALSNSLYFWQSNPSQNNSVLKISSLSDSEIYCSVKWSENGQYLVAGSDRGYLELFDVDKMTKLSETQPHLSRISSMSWKDQNVFSTGSRDNTIKNIDVRLCQPVASYTSHNQEVCGLAWGCDGKYLASGGNDNIVHIWDSRKTQSPILTFKEHTAAVRALCWSPHQYGILLSGGGNIDKSLKCWNVPKGILSDSIETDSQVCNLVFSKHSNHLVTTHGFSKNQIMLWDSNTFERLTVLEGHSSRVLHLALSPDSQNIATASADETLKFWKVFPSDEFESPERDPSLNLLLLRQTKT